MITTKYKIKNDFRNIVKIFDEQSNSWHFQHPYQYSKTYSNEDWFVLDIHQQSEMVFRAWIKPGVGEIDIQYCIQREVELSFLNRIMEEVE
jgi:hypothetical protein